MIDWTVVVDDCETPPRPNIRNVRLVNTVHGRKNFNFNFSSLVVGLPAPLSDEQLDWLWIAASLYAADVACVRGIDLDWARRIELHVPVSDPQRWEPFRVRLEQAFGRLTYDRLDLHFHPRTTPVVAPRPRRQPFEQVESVVLLSGGLDSFVGAVELLQATPSAFFVSHAGAAATRTAQRALQPTLTALSSGSEFAAFTAQRATGFGDREGSERSRTILFLACAGLVATALGVEEIYLCENGVMAVHLPLTEARVGSLSTRTAAPGFVDDFGTLIADVFGAFVEISNPLIRRTKPDVVELAQNLGCADQLPQTVSCWAIGHTRRHCGYCAPCMMRRISCEAHGAPDVAYDHDVFADEDVATGRPSAHDNLVQLVETASSITTATDEDMELRFPELLNSGREITSAQARDLHRRWAKQARDYLANAPVSARLL
jgi:7-cyano-7-deazaguanine synthase in queuosine biosynthesis